MGKQKEVLCLKTLQSNSGDLTVDQSQEGKKESERLKTIQINIEQQGKSQSSLSKMKNLKKG